MSSVSDYRFFERAEDGGFVGRYVVYSARMREGFVLYLGDGDGFLCPLTGEWVDLASIERVDELKGRFAEHVVACQRLATSHDAMNAYRVLAKTMSERGDQGGVDAALAAYAGQQRRHLVHSEDFDWARGVMQELRASLAVA